MRPRRDDRNGGSSGSRSRILSRPDVKSVASRSRFTKNYPSRAMMTDAKNPAQSPACPFRLGPGCLFRQHHDEPVRRTAASPAAEGSPGIQSASAKPPERQGCLRSAEGRCRNRRPALDRRGKYPSRQSNEDLPRLPALACWRATGSPARTVHFAQRNRDHPGNRRPKLIADGAAAQRAPATVGYRFALHRLLSAFFSFRSASRARSSHALAILSKVSRSFAFIDCAMRMQSAAYSRYVFASFIMSASSSLAGRKTPEAAPLFGAISSS